MKENKLINDPMWIFFCVMFFFVGMCFGVCVIAELQTQQTVVTITKGDGFTDYNFRSDNNNEDDAYYIIVNSDTVSSGVYKGGWK